MAWKGWEDYVPPQGVGSALQQPRANKFGAKATERDGLSFASKKEAYRYDQLKMLKLAGEVHSFDVHPRYDLWAAAPMCEARLVGHYTADFFVTWKSGEVTVEDVKGGQATKTEAYSLRKRVFEACHWPLTITEI